MDSHDFVNIIRKRNTEKGILVDFEYFSYTIYLLAKKHLYKNLMKIWQILKEEY